ncbi:MAG: hypothetical protein RMK49_20615 [Abditibacteriales bacterium]|nr:hypothetical protein [Abditibacteriales bacterium]
MRVFACLPTQGVLTRIPAYFNTLPMFCANHPTVSTAVTCGKCGKPICPRCMVDTPVGQRCRACGLQRSPIYQVPLRLMLVGMAVGIGGGIIGGMIGARLQFFVLFLAPVIGGCVGECVSRAIKRKHSHALALVTAIAIGLGAFFEPLRVALSHFDPSDPRWVETLYRSFLNPWAWFFIILAAPAAYWRLR